MEEVYIGYGLRSPIGKYGGGLASLRATEIASAVADAVLKRTGMPPTAVNRIVAGVVLQDMTESNPARIVAQRIGLPDTAPGFTVNMQCASGMVALILAANQVALGQVDSALVVGMESMSSAPYMVNGARFGLRGGHTRFIDSLEECKLAGSSMWGDPWNMIDVAENHVRVDGINREQADEYALLSHARTIEAIDGGRLEAEIAPIEIIKRGETIQMTSDEAPRRNLTMAQLAALPPVREGGSVTAGNASGHNDGAAVVLIGTRHALAAHGVEPLARINLHGAAIVGCDPRLMGYSAVDAVNAALLGSDLSIDDIDLIECNEGFAVQMVACAREGKWPSGRLNVDGGSIALGHPVGMSGLRIVLHLAHALRQRSLRNGLATVPAGSGLGSALLIEAT